MVVWQHRLNGHEFEQAPGDGEGQASLVCCSPQGRKELDTTEQLNNNNKDQDVCECIEQNKVNTNGWATVYKILVPKEINLSD